MVRGQALLLSGACCTAGGKEGGGWWGTAPALQLLAALVHW